ncbi:hypothetical protein N9523_04315, partial [Flavobacteriaceae bacterium]|nr:hypothetical protein [Flavobacteriaceae bacterium]
SKKFKKDFKRELKKPSMIFLTDLNQALFGTILYNDNSLGKLLAKSKEFGYRTFFNDNTNSPVIEGLLDNRVVIYKEGSIDDYGETPYYSIGLISKNIHFTGENIEDALVSKIVTEVHLMEYSNTSSLKISKYFDKLKNFINRAYEEVYNIEETNYEYGNDKIVGNPESGGYYDLIEYKIISKKDNPIQKLKITQSETTYTDRGKSGKLLTSFALKFTVEDEFTAELDKVGNAQIESQIKSKNNLRFTIGGEDMRNINEYDLEKMVSFFLEDCKKNNIKVPDINSLKARFVPLEGSTLALAYGGGDDSIINIEVDPQKWAESSSQKRWYVLYHELGHDVLNLDHGQGGKMMFNFADRDYTWDEFFDDKQYMFTFLKN